MATWETLRDEIKEELDLEEEDFVDDEDLLIWANDAVRDIASEILSINEGRYFKSEDTIDLVSGTATYSPPADIYANKITGMYYVNGSNKYKIHLLRNEEDIMHVESGDEYRYRIVNTTAAGTKIKLYPTPAANETDTITVYYIRNAKAITLDADVPDIPEAENFIKQYVKDKVVKKERMQPDAGDSPELARERKLVLEALSTMLLDGSEELTADLSYYCDFVGYSRGF